LPGDYSEDIAVLEIELLEGEESLYTRLIKPACIERSGFYTKEGVYQPGRMGRILGLGKLQESDLGNAKTLQVCILASFGFYFWNNKRIHVL
jgi:hypothetical protein